MPRYDSRVTIKEARSQKVSFRRHGEGMLHGILAFAVLAGVVTIGLTTCLLFCPREHIEVGLVVALLLLPGVAGLSLCIFLQVVWWRRYRTFHPSVRRRGFGAVFCFLGLVLIGCVLLLDLLR